jgi:hypothetical protein
VPGPAMRDRRRIGRLAVGFWAGFPEPQTGPQALTSSAGRLANAGSRLVPTLGTEF